MNRTPVRIRVIYADTDAMGIVYHTNYIRWFEIGRNELLRDIGIRYREVEGAGFHLPLTRVYCHYHSPARYDELVWIDTEVASLKRASIKFVYRVWDEGRQRMISEGYSVHACTNRQGRIVRLPAGILAGIQAYYPNLKGE